MNQQMADKLGNFKREVSALNKKVEQLTADKKSLQLLCAEQQDTINRKNDQIRRIMEIGRK